MVFQGAYLLEGTKVAWREIYQVSRRSWGIAKLEFEMIPLYLEMYGDKLPDMPELTQQEQQIFEETLRTGNWDIFTEYFFKLPKSGTWYTPEDRIEQYAQLYEAWQRVGKPDSEMLVEIDGRETEMLVSWDRIYYDNYPLFLLPHGFRMLPWAREFLAPATPLGIAITGTGTGKTAAVAIFALMCCALFPGFRFLNVAPTAVQADLILGEVEKWAGNTEFRKFIKKSRGANPMWVNKPHPIITIDVYPGHPSTFTCQTVGKDTTTILGGERDFINFDEAGLLANIEQAIPILVTRLRGTRSTGDPRWTMLRWISNPSKNPELLALLENYEKRQKEQGDAIALRDVPSTVNVYLTQKQLKQQAAAMDNRMADRWHGGSMEAAFETTGIAEHLIERCKDDDLDERVRKVGEYDDGLGVQHYALSKEQGHTYVVVGDVGKSGLTSMSSMNVPCVGVFDVTDFLEEPCPLVAFWWMDGGGSYRSVVDWMKMGMLKYRAMCYYDAQNVQTALEDFSGALDKWPTTPIMLAGQARGKRWAITILTQLMEDGMLAWPYIKGLWYQARIYDPKSKKKADDIVAMLLTFAMALQVEDTLWDRLVEKYNWVVEDDELIYQGESASVGIGGAIDLPVTDRHWRMGW